MNRMCIENKCRLGWLMDKQVWGGIHDKILRQEPDLNVKQEFTVVDQNAKRGLMTDLDQELNMAKQKRDQEKQQWIQQQQRAKAKGKGKAQSQSMATMPYDTPAKNQAGKGGKWKSGKGKGKEKVTVQK